MKAKKICAAAKMAAGVVTGYPKAIVEGASDLMGERLKEKTIAYIEENILPEGTKETIKVVKEEVKEEVKEHFPLLSRLFKIMS